MATSIPVDVLRAAERELAQVDLAAPASELARAFARCRRAAHEAKALAAGMASSMARLGHPGDAALAELIAVVGAIADAIAGDFDRFDHVFEHSSEAVLAGRLGAEAGRELLASHVRAAQAKYDELIALLGRADEIERLARAYYDRAFATLYADPAREAELDRRADAEIDAGGGFRGSIDALIKSIDG